MESGSRLRMIVQAAKEIRDNDVVLVGVGLPNLAANLAKKLYSPRLVLVYESGSIDCAPDRQPLSIGDPSLSENVSSLFSIFEIFSYLIVGGRIDVGYLGAAQVDSKGYLNSTVIGDYENPSVRLPGSGGACEILYYAKKSVVIVEFNDSKFRQQVDFITSSRRGLSEDSDGTGREEVIITDKCIIRIKGSGHAEMTAVYKDANIEELKTLAEKLNITIPEGVSVIDEPTEEEIRVLESMDPKGGTRNR